MKERIFERKGEHTPEAISQSPPFFIRTGPFWHSIRPGTVIQKEIHPLYIPHWQPFVLSLTATAILALSARIILMQLYTPTTAHLLCSPTFPLSPLQCSIAGGRILVRGMLSISTSFL